MFGQFTCVNLVAQMTYNLLKSCCFILLLPVLSAHEVQLSQLFVGIYQFVVYTRFETVTH